MIKKKNISQEDINTWNDYIKNPTDIVNKNINKKVNNISHRRFKYDFHGYTLIEANKKIKQIILECVEQNCKEILLITGKGIHSNTEHDTYVSKNFSKLRFSVPEYIRSDLEISKYLDSISNAEKNDGGDGAIIIKLKNL